MGFFNKLLGNVGIVKLEDFEIKYGDFFIEGENFDIGF